MAYTEIDRPDLYFNTKLYTGNGSTQSISGVNFTPDWVWIKRRNGAAGQMWQDVVRGSTKRLRSDVNEAEITAATAVTSFDSDGFSLGAEGGVNTNTATYASWNWLAGGTASSNTDGSITSQVSASTTSGFSIVSYTGTGSAGTLGHGLGSTPKMIIVKCRSNADTWAVYHESVGATKYMELDTTIGEQVSTQPWNDTAPASSVFTVGDWSATNGSGRTYIAYCFAEKKGFSKFGSYTGNGSTDGTFIYTGFKPAWVMYKVTNVINSWVIQDTKRSTFNVMDDYLLADNSNAEGSSSALNIDFLSNGFKHRNGSNASNASGNSYIYMAFAENPFTTSTGVPATAR